jgi:hypothetical protein
MPPIPPTGLADGLEVGSPLPEMLRLRPYELGPPRRHQGVLGVCDYNRYNAEWPRVDPRTRGFAKESP